MRVKKGHPSKRPWSKKKERYGDLTRHEEWVRLSRLVYEINNNFKESVKKKIVLDFQKNPRTMREIAEKFNVTVSVASYTIGKYCKSKFIPKP